ncbi:unnamed protein product [Rotaria sp. Silwood1]|nr:unnamed protein product [Rotaria sp. Silwood1]
MNFDTSILPNNIFTLQKDDFFQIIKSLVGEGLYEILKIQSIDSAENLMTTTDVFDVFKYESPQLLDIQNKYFFKMQDGQYLVKTGIKNSLLYVLKLLRSKKEEQEPLLNNNQQEQIDNNFINNHPLLRSLILWYQSTDNIRDDNDHKHSFLKIFIDNIICNISKSSNHFRYHDLVKKFAICLYILGGKQTYEFIRMNLYGSLPSLFTLNDILNNSDTAMEEGEFTFDALQQQLHSLDTKFCFSAEDSTGIIRKIKYNAKTNSFVGFLSPLDNGIPIPKSFKTNSFEELKIWYDTIEKAPLLNVHMVQPIPSISDQNKIPTSFILSAYGVSNKFTANDVLGRWKFIFENCLKRKIRLIGISTGKYQTFHTCFL